MHRICRYFSRKNLVIGDVNTPRMPLTVNVVAFKTELNDDDDVDDPLMRVRDIFNP